MGRLDTESADTASSVGTLVYLTIGPILWGLHLFTVYGLQPVLCSRSAPANTTFVAITTVVLLGLLLAVMLWPHAVARLLHARAASRASRRFHRRVVRWAGLLSAAGIVWAGAAALIVPACQGLR